MRNGAFLPPAVQLWLPCNAGTPSTQPHPAAPPSRTSFVARVKVSIPWDYVTLTFDTYVAFTLGSSICGQERWLWVPDRRQCTHCIANCSRRS